ncbi:MAG: gliding motility-associated C-terminal domain-containing protein [Flavobacteriales bacterium]|nr:gliding motility-associated C-terminal domain-containing protein [Flavobacteriales bacterium]
MFLNDKAMIIRPFQKFLLVLFLFLIGIGQSQAQSPYIPNGDAVELSCNCYRLTEAQNNQGGSVWNENLINLTDSFDFTFDVYLGEQNGGADGIAFVLQPVSTSEGNIGGGLGYEAISPSVAVEVDTWSNNSQGQLYGDPAEDHMAIQANGDPNHTTVNNLAGPEFALSNGDNIEDGETHLMRVVWDPTTNTLDSYMDGSLRVSYTGDMVTDVFNNDPMVFWGFTGSTGGANNVQEFCLSIIPGLTSSTEQICQGETVLFEDDSYSALGDVVSWDWDFGNGTQSTEQNPGEILFEDAGTYTVTQIIVDAAGCDATDDLEIVVSPNPEANFSTTEVCIGSETVFVDESTVATGSIDEWNWEFNGTTATGDMASTTYSAAGTFNVVLQVATDNGCVATVEDSVTVFENPTATATNQITGFDVIFDANLLDGETAEWIIDNEPFDDLDTINYTFPDSGWYQITLTVTNENGCTDFFEDSIYIDALPTYEPLNVFTPNGDETNDFFEPTTYAMVTAKMEIYNRWGRPVFKYDDAIPQSDNWGWNGTINGKGNAQEGTYFFLLDMVGIDGNVYSERGYLTLIR